MKFGEFRRRALHHHVLRCQNVLQAASKTGTDRIEPVATAELELWDHVRNEGSVAQPLECVLAGRILGISVVLVPSRGRVFAIILDRFSRRRHVWRFRRRSAIMRRSGANRLVNPWFGYNVVRDLHGTGRDLVSPCAVAAKHWT